MKVKRGFWICGFARGMLQNGHADVRISYKEKIDTLQNEFRISVSREISEQARETAYELQAMGMPNEKIAKAVKVSIDVLQGWFAEREGKPLG